MENSDSWASLALRFRDSVVQLRCTRGVYNVYRPYQSPKDQLSSGTGFLVNGAKGLLLTNAHVVANAINITGRLMSTGKRDLPIRLLSISRERDLALCQLDPVPTDPGYSPTSFTFGDSMYLRETQEVMAIGYPLGFEGVKYTTGVISGFFQEADDMRPRSDELRSDPEEEPAYIQITAPINPGNSGGPILNRSGEVVGVAAAGYLFSQNVAFAIPSRTVLAVWEALRSGSSSHTHVVPLPRFAFEFQKTNEDLLRSLGSDPKEGGVYIKEVYPSSCWCGLLKKGDILLRILFPEKDAPLRECRIDRYGEVTIPSLQFGRRLSIKEVFDMLPFDSPVFLDLRRKGQLYRASGTFSYRPSSLRPYLYPRFQPLLYLIVAGLCLGDLTMNHLSIEKIQEYGYGEKRYKPRVVVDQVFPGTSASELDLFSEGTLLRKVQGKKVRTIEQVREILTSNPSSQYLSIETQDRDLFVLSREQARLDNQTQVSRFQISESNTVP